ncbi:MAG: hypothetical protein AAF645_12255 [Myxococcota bacterium]
MRIARSAVVLLLASLGGCGQIWLDDSARDGGARDDGMAELGDGAVADGARETGNDAPDGGGGADAAGSVDAMEAGTDATEGSVDAMEGGVDAADGGSRPVFLSDSNACVRGAEGPFAEVGSVATGNPTRGLWFRDPYLVSAETFGGLASYRFDGANFTEIDRITGIWFTMGIYAEGETFVVGSPGRGLYRIRMDGEGRFTEESLTEGDLVEARQAWSDGFVTFVPTGGDGFHAVERVEEGYRILDTVPTATNGWSEAAFARDGRIWLAQVNAGLRLFRFESERFLELDVFSESRMGSLWVTADLVIAGSMNRLQVWENADVLGVPLDRATVDGVVEHVWSDGATIFATVASRLYAFSGTRTLREADQIDLSDTALSVVGDSQFIFVGENDSAIRAYAGFECLEYRE